jgi:methionyl-tRNA formyltransferase
VVACGQGGLKIEELQLQGSRRLSVDEFISGHKISVDDEFSRK